MKPISSPEILKFYVEAIEKENKKRTQWFLKNQEKIEEMALLPKTYKNLRSLEVMKTPLRHCMPSLSEDQISFAVNRRKKVVKNKVHQLTPKGEVQLPGPIMKPVNPEVKKQLYEPYGGRLLYLKQRVSLKPEDRYNECETENTGYGWRLADSRLVERSIYGRYFVFKHDLISRRGPHIPDPEHYKEPT